MENQLIEQFLNFKLSVLFAGLFGAFITMLRKSEGSLQARFAGFVSALASVLYLVPFIIWLIQWRGKIILPLEVQNVLSFAFGMLAQRLTENFIDNPTETVILWSRNIKKAYRAVRFNESFTSISPNKQEKEKGVNK